MTTELKETISKSPRGRPTRTPVAKRSVLTVIGKDPAFEYRIVNDEGDRIAAFQDAGWEVEKASAVRVGDKRVNNATPEGSLAQVSVSKKSGEKAFVMKIKKEWFKEDQDAKALAIRQLEDTMKQSTSGDGNYGSIKIER